VVRGVTRPGRALLFLAIAAAQFALFEIALRAWGHSEASPAFQTLFTPDPVIGYRLRPHALTQFVTAEFSTTIAINGQGVRDDAEIGPKPANERRIVVLGDSLVLSVQVERRQTFCSLLQDALNRGSNGVRYRVINAGVQGYGPVEELLFYREVARAFQPDLVIQTIFVGNDAEEAVISAPRLRGAARPAAEALSDSLVDRLRRLVRRSMVMQVARLRVVSVTDRLPRFGAPPEPPLQSYAASPAPRIAEGLRISRECVQSVDTEARASGARTMVMLMPARFQVDDADYGRLKDAVSGAGGTLVRDAATTRFHDALTPLALPQFDALPALRAALPGPDVFFQQTVHLTPRGHEVVARALEAFIRGQGL
jgi:lysophospholipase L1-like esterase